MKQILFVDKKAGKSKKFQNTPAGLKKLATMLFEKYYESDAVRHGLSDIEFYRWWFIHCYAHNLWNLKADEERLQFELISID